MKSIKKAVLLVLCMVALVTAAVFGTLAYLTDSEEVINTFTVGNVDITVDEAPVTPDGEIIPDEDRVTENKYHLIPGQSYVKDPTMTVMAGSEESYVRMLVAISDYSDILAVFGEDFLPQDFVEGWDNEIWVTTGVIAVDEAYDVAVYEFRYHETVDGFVADGEDEGDEPDAEDVVLEALFTKFTIPGELTGEQLEQIQDMKIAVQGHAIQTAGFEDADEAWEAFEEQYSKVIM